MRSHPLWLILPALLVGVILWRESGQSWLTDYDRRFHAWVISNTAAPDRWTQEVVLVGIDERTLESLPDWPWTELDYALFMRIVEPRGPAAVGIVPPIAQGTGEDAMYGTVLRDLIQRSTRLVLNATIDQTPDRWAEIESRQSGFPILPRVSGDTTQMPDFARIQEASTDEYRMLAPNGPTHAADGTMEDGIPLAYRFQGRVVPSFVTQLVRMALNVSEQDLDCIPGGTFTFGDKGAVTIDSTASMVSDWRALQLIQHISYFDLLVASRQSDAPENESLLESIRGCVVLLGRTDPAARTRMDSYGRVVSDVEFHAMGISTLLNRSWVRPAPQWLPFAVIGGGILLTLCVVYLSRFHGFLLLMVTGALYPAAAVVLFETENILLPGVLAAGMLLFALLCLIAKPSRNALNPA